ncbi:MAG: N-acyl-D-amino-acid deacylase family protein, partial [Candidatus Binataceae bacterium]
MAYDLLIKNGLVIDGTGNPGRRADVAVGDGKIFEIGRLNGSARQTIDAADCVVSPGFIDPHTHYDAQICWDGAVTPSSWHGVTSVVMGNCGVGIAPCLPASREVAMRDLVNVEAIPFEALEQGITWDWETFPQYMDAAARRKPSVNLAFLAPLTPFRHYVMGEASMERAAIPEETARIAALLSEAMDAGAFGFSSTILNQHLGFGGRPLACRNASREELKAYANVLRKKNKGAIEIALTRQIGVLEEDQCEMLDLLLDESGRAVTFIALFDRDDIPEAVRDTLRRAAPMIAKGARPQTSPLPLTREIDMRSPFSFAAFPSWQRVFADTSRQAQKAVYRDPAFRNQFREELKNPLAFGNWERVTLHEVRSPKLKRFEGMTVAEIARDEGKDGVDTFLDLTLADNLALEFTMTSYNTRVDRMAELL